MYFFKIKSTYLIALLYSLLFARVSGRFEAFSEHQNSANSPKTLENGPETRANNKEYNKAIR